MDNGKKTALLHFGKLVCMVFRQCNLLLDFHFFKQYDFSDQMMIKLKRSPVNHVTLGHAIIQDEIR